MTRTHKKFIDQSKVLKSIPKYFSVIEKLHSQIIFCNVATLIVHPRLIRNSFQPIARPTEYAISN